MLINEHGGVLKSSTKAFFNGKHSEHFSLFILVAILKYLTLFTILFILRISPLCPADSSYVLILLPPFYVLHLSLL